MREAALYGVAAASYIGLGVLVPELLVSWPVGAAYLLLVAWVVPALVRRFR